MENRINIAILRDNALFKRKQEADEKQAIKDYEKQASIMNMAIDMARNGMVGNGYKDPVSLYARNMAQRAIDRATEDKGRQLADSMAKRGIRTEIQEKMNYNEIKKRIKEAENKAGREVGFALVGNRDIQNAAYDARLLSIAAARVKTSDDAEKAYESILNAGDFEKYAEKGAVKPKSRLKTDLGTVNEVNDELQGKFFNTRIPGENKPLSMEIMERAIRKFNDNTEYDPTAAAMLDDDERSIYNYLLGKYGEGKADEYIKFKLPELNERAGEIVAKNKDSLVDKLLYATQGAESAGDDLIKGINLLTGDEPVQASRRDYATLAIKEDLNDTGAKIGGQSLGNIAYDAVETTANMIPAVAAGNVAGGAIIGLTAGSRAANEAWKEGSSRGESIAYGAINGALEATLQRYLGGISRLGGKLSGITKDVISSKAKSTLGKALINMGVTSLSEGSEEYLQEIIDPVIQNVVLGKDNDLHFVTKDALYAGFLGALTGNVFEAGTNISKAAADSRTNKIYVGIGKNTNDNQKSEILDYAKNADEDTTLKSALTEYNNNPNEANLGRLRMETEKDIGEKIGKASDADEAENMRNDMADNGSYISDVAREAMEDVGFINTEEPINEITASNEGFADKDVAEYLEMSDEAKFIMNDSMDDATDTETYQKGFEDMYRYGRAGIGYETAEENSLHAGELSVKQKKLAYITGLNDRQEYFNERQQRISGRVNRGQGILRYVNESETRDGIRIPRMLDDMSRRQRNSIKAIRHIAEITGQNIALYESEAVNGELTAPNGWYDPDTDTIYIDVNSGDVGEHAMMRTASHEMTHAIKEWSPVKYRKLQDYVTGQYEADGSLMALVQHEIDNAAANGKTLTYEQALDEVTANACEMMLRDSKAIEKLAREEPSIFTRIKDVITGIVNDIKRAFEGIKGNTFEYKRMEELLDDWSGIQKLWDDAFVDMSRNTNRAEKAAVESKKGNGTEGNVDESNPYIYSFRMGNVEYGMKDEERYNILKDAKVKVADGNISFTENEINNLGMSKPYKMASFFKLLADKFGLYTSYRKGDIEFNYSKQSVKESIHKSDQNYRKNKEIAEMMYCTKDIIDNAVPIIIHDDMYKGTLREDVELKKVYVMLGAYENNGSVYPVEVIAKERADNKNNIYMEVTLNKTGTNVMKADYGIGRNNTPRKVPVEVSVTDILKDVKPEHGRFLRYFPDRMLNNEQREAAALAREETAVKVQMLREGKRPTNKGISDTVKGNTDTQNSLRDNRSNREILVNAHESTAADEASDAETYKTYFNERQQRINTKVNKGQGILRYVNDSETKEGIKKPRLLNDMSSNERNSVKALRHIAQITGQNIALYESEAVNGEVTVPNGWYDPDTDTIYIDMNSGDVGEHAMMRTASHEITHVVKKWSPVKYRKLQDYVIGQYEADNSLMTLVQYEMDTAKANGRRLTYEQAVDEVTANACEMMLKDSKAIQQLAKEEPSIFVKIRDVITGIVNDIKKAFAGLTGKTVEYKRMKEILNDWSDIQKLWDDAFIDMLKNANKAKKAAVTDGGKGSTDTMHNDGTYIMASYLAGKDVSAVAMITVEAKTNDITKIDIYDNIHAVSGRPIKEGTSRVSISNETDPTVRDKSLAIEVPSNITIAELLEKVKQTHASVLSEDVKGYCSRLFMASQ